MSLDGFTLSNSSRVTVKKILDHPKLEFYAKVDLKKQVVNDYVQEAKYKDLHFRVVLPPYTPIVYIRGNFYHYLHGMPNTGDFSFPEFLTSLDRLSNEFHLNPEETKMIKLEMGANIRTPVHPRDVIDNIIAYKGKQKELQEFKGKGYDGVFDFQEYLVRLYCKSCKNKLSDPVLRVELASQKSNYLKKLGIHHLSDLLEVESHVPLGNQLLRHVSDFIYDDLELDLSKLNQHRFSSFQ